MKGELGAFLPTRFTNLCLHGQDGDMVSSYKLESEDAIGYSPDYFPYLSQRIGEYFHTLDVDYSCECFEVVDLITKSFPNLRILEIWNKLPTESVWIEKLGANLDSLCFHSYDHSNIGTCCPNLRHLYLNERKSSGGFSAYKKWADIGQKLDTLF